MARGSAQCEPRAFVEVVQVLRDVAGHEQGIDPHRAAISASVAALVAACGRYVEQLPPDVASMRELSSARWTGQRDCIVNRRTRTSQVVRR